ncbi:DUF6011 domain-containing protein [Gordonia humi]|uniref:Putative OB-fold protein n=1 Tax=Gordonia humi TaxID=686429 RepID=A0A840EWQ3_9ACTN|nr:DUF6011 domain-containing protein [Gordonia humi]MBB4134733.1 putative OB-fold protein [Gordonia humi]
MFNTQSIRPRSEAEQPDDRVIREHIEALAEHGYVVGVRCRNCGAILTARRSVDLHVGPVCRGRVDTSA